MYTMLYMIEKAYMRAMILQQWQPEYRSTGKRARATPASKFASPQRSKRVCDDENTSVSIAPSVPPPAVPETATDADVAADDAPGSREGVIEVTLDGDDDGEETDRPDCDLSIVELLGRYKLKELQERLSDMNHNSKGYCVARVCVLEKLLSQDQRCHVTFCDFRKASHGTSSKKLLF